MGNQAFFFIFMFKNTMEKWEPTKKLTKPDGTIAYIWDNKLHNWEGPALIPEGNMRKREYYIYGFKKTEKEWKAALKDREGLPWYKKPSITGTSRY